MLVDYRAGCRSTGRTGDACSPHLYFDYTEDVMAARDRPNRFFGHYGIRRGDGYVSPYQILVRFSQRYRNEGSSKQRALYVRLTRRASARNFLQPSF
jgi:hypothetical protein